MLNIPVLFLIFNRPDTTDKVFNAIREAQPKYLYVAADGPRVGNMTDVELCNSTKQIIDKVDWPCEVKTLYRTINLGCGKAVSEAITWFFNQVEYGIVLEDDCLPEGSFFEFCETMLVKYKDDSSKAVVCGTNYLYTEITDVNEDYFLSTYTSVWGWASWSRVVNKIEWNVNNLKPLIDEQSFSTLFSSNNKIATWLYSIIKLTFENKLDTWDTIFVYNLILSKTKNIVPIKNQISNIGITGTHTSNNESDLSFKTFPINFSKPLVCSINQKYNLQMLSNIEKRIFSKPSFFKRLKQKLSF